MLLTQSTGKERDTESGLDYFGSRYYASSMGRFSSPDPSGLVYADQSNPQSFNLYSYVGNNPLKFIDPLGLYSCDPHHSSTSTDSEGNTSVTVTAGKCHFDDGVFGTTGRKLRLERWLGLFEQIPVILRWRVCLG